MEQAKKDEILEKAKTWMKNVVVVNHVKNTKKLVNLDEFNINPFLWPYLANYYCGNSSPLSLATVAVLPRVLGTSINTSFGQNMQSFISDVLDSSLGSPIDGIDIEYIDAVDNRRKYCQVKSGPTALNKPDVTTIKDNFKSIINRARANSFPLDTSDLVFAMLYGDKKEYNPFVKERAKDYVVISGEEFWFRLTGDRDFYHDLAKAMAEIAETVDAKKLVEETIKSLANDIEKKMKADG